MIHSRIHQMAENVLAETGAKASTDSRLHNLLTSPTYVIQPDAFRIMERTACGDAVKAMQQAGLLRLPQPRMVVEWCIRESRVEDVIPPNSIVWEERYKDLEPCHEFVHLTERKDDFGNWGVIAEFGFLLTRTNIGGMFQDKCVVALTSNGINYSVAKEIGKVQQDIIIGATIIALNAALVLMNMKGIEREEHRNPALNKQRVKRGKPAIRDYSYIHIGHVYKQDGGRIKYKEGDIRTVAMHVRAAHVRRQHYGEKNSLEKIILVPSVIVNFDPDKELKHKPRIVKA